MAENFDVVIIGSGPGGYFAAIRCAQKKATVAIIEKAETGGTCLNRGCIPSKALLASAEVLLRAKNAGGMGVDVASISPNWVKMQQRKDAIVAGSRKGLTGLLGANKIKIFQGTATASSPKTVVVEAKTGQTEINATKGIIIATGSIPVEIPAFPFDGQTVISSTEALSLQAIPASMVIVGGGIIGCELACVYAAVGTKVTIVEALERIISTEDKWVSQLLERELKKLGIAVLTGQKVTSVDVAGGMAKVVLQSAVGRADGETPRLEGREACRSPLGGSGHTIEAEKVLVSVGRRAICDKQTIDNLKLQTNGPAIKVNDRMQTNVPGVYAIGDVVGTTYLAHGAFAEAEVAAENINGGDSKIGDYSLIPRAVYTFPEIASVGKSEERCAKEGIEVAVGRGFFKANGRSIAHNETTGEIRVVREKASDKILGVTMVGANVTELVSAARLIIGSTEKFNAVSFPHPTVSEVLKEAWEDAFGLSIHQPPRQI
jgi:dihydrolipoamide dehydrogenase